MLQEIAIGFFSFNHNQNLVHKSCQAKRHACLSHRWKVEYDVVVTSRFQSGHEVSEFLRANCHCGPVGPSDGHHVQSLEHLGAVTLIVFQDIQKSAERFTPKERVNFSMSQSKINQQDLAVPGFR